MTNKLEVVRDGDFHAALADGKAVQFYSGYFTLKSRMQEQFPEANVWYTERNGDGIAMLVPKGIDNSKLPDVAMEYLAFEWIDPEKDFGTGVCPWKINQAE